jgi:hypothetical protein
MKLLGRSILPIVLLTSLSAVPHVSATTIFASDARNVSDFEQVFNPDGTVSIITDGDGDQRSLPNYPWLGAGIFLSGASGQNGTARFQMEFSLAGITAPIASAFLVLNSDFETNQTLDTEFFHVTTDEEGDVSVNDFQSAAVATGIVQPPVLANQTHMYDVTSFVQLDVMAGFSYTSFQGRVDEDADTVFRRGVEFFSLALDPAINDDPALRPRLVVNFVPEPKTMWMFGAGLAALLALRHKSRRP